MRAVVVGVGWGRVHVAALREAGVQVVALVARQEREARAVADELGVPLGVGGLDRVGDLGVDLVSVATPPQWHAPVIAALPGSVPVLCEKPAVGMSAPVGLPPGRVAPAWVNYAFAFLPAARVAGAAVGRIGPVRAVRVDTGYDLDAGPASAVAMFFELVVHPWSWLVTLLGAPRGLRPVGSTGLAQGAHATSIEVGFGEVAGRVSCRRRPGLAGIAHEVVLEGDRGQVRVSGRYRVGGPWLFHAEIDTGAGWNPLDTGPDLGPEDGGDPWYRANATAIAAAVAAVRGGPLDRRLFDWDRALGMDRVAQAQLRAGGWAW